MSIKKLWKSFWNWLTAELVEDVSDMVDIDGDKPETGDGGIITEEEEPPKRDDDDVPFDRLNWCYGGFDGENAERVDGVKIALDSVSPSGLRYHYVEGNLNYLSYTNTHDNPDCLACLFCLNNGVWRGGKFDWISTDRLTRDFHNIETGYHGWDESDIDTAEAYAFVIVSKDGKKRTNVADALKKD